MLSQSSQNETYELMWTASNSVEEFKLHLLEYKPQLTDKQIKSIIRKVIHYGK